MRQELISSITLQEIADFCGDVKISGDSDCKIKGVATLQVASESDISFLINDKYKPLLEKTKASAIIVTKELSEYFSGNKIISINPRLTLVRLMQLLPGVVKEATGIHNTAVIGENCKISADVSIGANCVIGNNCTISSGVDIKPNVTIYDNVRIDKNCIIHSGAVIGSDGFGYAHQDGKWYKMPHVGGVVLENNVEIGANTTIDRGFLGNTTISSGVIIDNQVQIGHNVTIGENTAIAGCVGIAGSASIGARCLIGGGAKIAGHIEIADDVHITATSAVNSSINTPGSYSSGFPAKPSLSWHKNVARFNFLDSMSKRLRDVEAKLQKSIKEIEK